MSASPVLLIDAHQDSRVIYSAALRHGGYAVVECAWWDEGLEAAGRVSPRVIVLELPLMSSGAWDTLRALRDDPRLRGVPVLGVGTTGQPEARDRALALGCAEYLLKPCSPLEVLAACDRVAGAVPAPA